MTTLQQTNRNAFQWYHEAERTYTEKHQGCPWCGGSHRVFCQRRETKVIFCCQACDFQVAHDSAVDQFTYIRGEHDDGEPIPETMCHSPNPLTCCDEPAECA